jgi:hypothetical protein
MVGCLEPGTGNPERRTSNFELNGEGVCDEAVLDKGNGKQRCV